MGGMTGRIIRNMLTPLPRPYGCVTAGLNSISGQFLQTSAPGNGSPGRVTDAAPASCLRAMSHCTTAAMCSPGIMTLVSPRSVLPAL